MGKSSEKFAPPEAVLNFANLAKLMIAAFQWKDRVENLMLPSEVEFVLRDFPPVRSDARDSLAYLIHSGVFPSSPEMADEKRMATRGEMVFILNKAIRSYFDPSRKGVLRGLTRKNELEVEADGGSLVIPVSPDVFLFRAHEGEVFPASRLYLLGGEDIRWVENGGEIDCLEVSYPVSTSTLDRGSPFHRWLVRQSKTEIEKRINEYYPIGELQDIVVPKRGTSHRAIDLAITGTESQVVVKGLKIRWVLGLRDTLFISIGSGAPEVRRATLCSPAKVGGTASACARWGLADGPGRSRLQGYSQEVLGTSGSQNTTDSRYHADLSFAPIDNPGKQPL